MADEKFEKLSKTGKIFRIYNTCEKQKNKRGHYQSPCEILMRLVKKYKRYAHFKFQGMLEN